MANTVKASLERDSEKPAPRRHEGHERARARHALRDAPEDVPGGAHGGSVLADRADPDRAGASTRTARSPRSGCGRCSWKSSPRRSRRASRRSSRAGSAGRSSRSTSGTTASGRAGSTPRNELDAIVKKKYPTAEAFQEDIPNILVKLGFSKERADYLAVPHRRRSGARLGPRRRRRAPRRQGAPAHARREGRDELQGLQHRGPRARPQRRADVLAQRHRLRRCWRASRTRRSPRRSRSCSRRTTSSSSASRSPTPRASALRTLNDFWATFEIAGVALVDMAVWHWMYDHPNANPAELKAATLADLQGRLEQVLRADLQEEGRRLHARHLLAHDRRLPLPAGLSDRPPHRVPDRGAGRRRPATSARSSSAWPKRATSLRTSG